jgi:hypothetical protein
MTDKEIQYQAERFKEMRRAAEKDRLLKPLAPPPAPPRRSRLLKQVGGKLVEWGTQLQESAPATAEPAT